jgi:hypothetical protein
MISLAAVITGTVLLLLASADLWVSDLSPAERSEMGLEM